MNKITGFLITTLIILTCSNYGFSQSVSKDNKLSINLTSKESVWIESNRNIKIRKHGGVGFLYTYKLPDVQNEAIALYRTYNIAKNNAYTIIDISNEKKDLKTLKGRVKFSGSDINQTHDTLIISAYYSKTKNLLLIKNLNEGHISKNANILKISAPLAQFEPFSINLSKSKNNDNEKEYLIIQLIIKSGSNDNYYYGTSNAVIDNLHFNS